MFKLLKSENNNSGFIKQHKNSMVAFIKIIDILIIILIFNAILNSDGYFIQGEQNLILFFAIFAFEFFATTNNIYASPRGVRFLYIIKNILTTWLMVSFTVLIAFNLTTVIEFNQRIHLLSWLLITPIIIILWHLIVRRILSILRTNKKNSHRAAIIGATDVGHDLEHILAHQTWMGFSVEGYYDDRAAADDRITTVNVIGTVDELINKIKNNEFDFIFITLPMSAEKRIVAIISELRDTSVVVYYVPNLFVFGLLGARLENFNGIPVVSIFDMPNSNGLDGFYKKSFDIILASLILLVISIPMLLIALGIKLTSTGTVLFKQKRCGYRGEEICVWKFRTMIDLKDGSIVEQATKNDPRITKFGQFLRRTSLDELPQFINVLQGTMSIVGPRPHAIIHNEFYRKQISGYMLRCNVKPGITGLAQIRGFRGETDTIEKMENRIKADLEYIQTWSIWLDLDIFLKTVFKGFLHKNAY